MRRVAREVGVEAMSLYHHVAEQKTTSSTVVCAHVMASYRVPPQDGLARGWDEPCPRRRAEWRRVLKSHPNVVASSAASP